MPRFFLLAAAVACGLTAPGAQAGLLPVNVTITPEAGNYRWTYAIVLPTDSQLQSGNYFTLYDFGGYIPGGEMAPDGWAFTASQTGPTPALTVPNDDPNAWNLSWQYTGPTILTGQTGLGNFWAYSTSGSATTDFFTAQTFRSSDGLSDRNVTTTLVPDGAGAPPAGVPEPGTLVLAGLGLPLVGLARARRRAAS